MTKNIIIMIATLILISSCSQDNEKKTTNENMLLAQEVSVSCVAVVDNQDTPDWTKGFNRLDFFKTVYKKAMSGKPFVYGDAALRDTINRKVFSANEIEKRMKSHVDTLDFDLLKEIRSLEKWEFDRTTLKFSKDVTAWVPIKIWEENGKTKKQQIFYVPRQLAARLFISSLLSFLPLSYNILQSYLVPGISKYIYRF